MTLFGQKKGQEKNANTFRPVMLGKDGKSRLIESKIHFTWRYAYFSNNFQTVTALNFPQLGSKAPAFIVRVTGIAVFFISPQRYFDSTSSFDFEYYEVSFVRLKTFCFSVTRALSLTSEMDLMPTVRHKMFAS